MFKRLLSRPRQSPGATGQDPSNVHDALRAVRSLEEAREAIEARGWSGDRGPESSGLDALRQACAAMRARGMALEPNLLGRAACELILDRRQAGQASSTFAADDTDFVGLARSGDDARDRGAFADAQFRYWQALQLYPLHPGYLVQYAHCLKERDLFPDAVVNYLDAYLHGAPRQDVEEHALFVADRAAPEHRLRSLFERGEAGFRTATPLAMPPSSQDVVAVCRLFTGAPPKIDQVARLMCSRPDRTSLISSLLREGDFARTHRQFLTLVAETGWGTP